MGHTRLGRLPKTREWRQVIELLENPSAEASAVARVVARAAAKRLDALEADPSLSLCYWLLTRITWHARFDEFADRLGELGIKVTGADSALSFVANVATVARERVSKMESPGAFSEMAQLAMREVLTDLVSRKAETLFGTTAEDLRNACKSLSTKVQFGDLSRRFFASFLNRALQFFVSKEISNFVGKGKRFRDIAEIQDFNRALNTFCYESAKIVEDFSAGWYSKRNWQGEITEEDAQRFVAVAIEKLTTEVYSGA